MLVVIDGNEEQKNIPQSLPCPLPLVQQSPNALKILPAAMSYQTFHLLSAYNVEELEAVENLPINRKDPFHAG